MADVRRRGEATTGGGAQAVLMLVLYGWGAADNGRALE